jgi:sarcosine oxidase subunit delta
MSFLVRCPNCGPRSAYEFHYGGEYRTRPTGEVTARAWNEYLYFRHNVAGIQQEWWLHQQGCGRWFLARRDTRTNTLLETKWP